MIRVWLLENEQARWFEFEEPHDMPDDVTVTMLTETEQPAQQEQGDSICQQDDGCPTELAVLQRFWRGQPIPDEHYPAWFRPSQQEPLPCET